jgi:hypothetical protein
MDSQQFDQWITGEIEAFRKSEAFARTRTMQRYAIYSGGVADALEAVRSVWRTSLAPDLVKPGDVIMAYHLRKCR